jgi:DNA-directed RNA polymerase specialized sigma24 family protein
MTMSRAQPAFDDFVTANGRQLRQALVARFGVDVGTEVSSEALAYAWQHWQRIEALDNPIGYLYRVGVSAARRHHRWRRPVALPLESAVPAESAAEDLAHALSCLTEHQRVCVILVHVHDWSYERTAAATGLSLPAVGNHLRRGLRRLRAELENDR